MYLKNIDGMTEVKGPKDVPEGHHFAVIIFNAGSIQIPGDERSRTNPGHGYPAHTHSYNDYKYWVTTDQAVLERFVESLELEDARDKKPYVFFTVSAKGSVIKKVQFNFPPTTR